jgi:hypothetical protein
MKPTAVPKICSFRKNDMYTKITKIPNKEDLHIDETIESAAEHNRLKKTSNHL